MESPRTALRVTLFLARQSKLVLAGTIKLTVKLVIIVCILNS